MHLRRHFRLPRSVANELITGFASSPMWPTHNHGGKAAKSAKTQILNFIWYVANKTCVRDVADRFDLAEGDEMLDDSDEEEPGDVHWSKRTDSNACQDDNEEDSALPKLGELKREKVFAKMFGRQ
ncbi:hypothetical protein HPB50_010321 [Hyalomma asiaticum]|uniref:Uncharacterized protein n=1 Tax=Hyalomma asiaticum TaxID=266040 RepID=A0ACB7T6L2_HYAAI|nr:hypothetical protein HPB50_010321 [Hyalomma asiaticum]